MGRAAALLLSLAASVPAADREPRTRELERINWLEFREWVPERVRTVLLPLGTLEPLTVPEDAYRAYVRSVLVGLARNRFRNIILINGHGGGQTALLSALAQEVGREERVRTFDPAKAKAYYLKVNDKVGRLVEDTIRKWDLAWVFEEGP